MCERFLTSTTAPKYLGSPSYRCFKSSVNFLLSSLMHFIEYKHLDQIVLLIFCIKNCVLLQQFFCSSFMQIACMQIKIGLKKMFELWVCEPSERSSVLCFARIEGGFKDADDSGEVIKLEMKFLLQAAPESSLAFKRPA